MIKSFVAATLALLCSTGLAADCLPRPIACGETASGDLASGSCSGGWGSNSYHIYAIEPPPGPDDRVEVTVHPGSPQTGPFHMRALMFIPPGPTTTREAQAQNITDDAFGTYKNQAGFANNQVWAGSPSGQIGTGDYTVKVRCIKPSRVTLLERPCRVADTRVAPFKMPDFFPFHVRLRDYPWNGQGGTVNCSVPDEATGAVFNLSVISPDAAGHVTVWPWGRPMPLTAAILIPAANQVIANNVTTAISPPGSDYSVSLYATTRAHYTVDLVGFLEP